MQRGFFAAVDAPPNPASYTALPHGRCAGSGTAHRLAATTVARHARARAGPHPIGVLTGELGARIIGPLVESLDRTDVRVLPVANDFFGGNTGVTGLMTGEDVSRLLAGQPEGHRYLLPDVCLSDEGRFLDGVTVDQLPRAVEIVPTDGISLAQRPERTLRTDTPMANDPTDRHPIGYTPTLRPRRACRRW